MPDYIPAKFPDNGNPPIPGTPFQATGALRSDDVTEGDLQMSKPLMAKATAVWLVDNTTISFKQIADFVSLHE